MEKTISEPKIRDFEGYLRNEEKSRATIEKYLRDVRAFRIFAGDRQITKEITAEYKMQLIQRGFAPASVNSMLASVNSFLNYFGWKECTVKSMRIQRNAYCSEEKELTKGEYLRLLEAAKEKKWLYALLQTICATGIRVSELSFFTVEAIRSGTVSVRCKSKTRFVFVPEKLRKLLLAFARERGIRTGAVFVTRTGKPLDRSYIWAQMKRLCEAAGVKTSKVFPHNLRKLFARTFYALEKDIAKLADILGHSSIDTTRIYIVTSGVEHRRKIERMGLLLE